MKFGCFLMCVFASLDASSGSAITTTLVRNGNSASDIMILGSQELMLQTSLATAGCLAAMLS